MDENISLGFFMRIQSIDYLRGIMALTVVLYHFSIIFNRWGPIDSSTLLGRFGVYAVSAFYVISGMAMYLAHKKTEWTVTSYSVYMFKRYLRLAPVYCLVLAVIAYMSLHFGTGFKYEILSLITNITLTFGIFNPSDYIVMGGWSIGNEMVFYLFVPVFILMVGTRFFTWFLIAISSAILYYCSYHYLNGNSGLGAQWVQYINPLNQIFFFMFGVAIASLLRPYVGKSKSLYVLISILLFATFYFFPASGDLINIITGDSKVIFTVTIVALCSSFYLIGDLTEIKPVHVILKFLGDISYPLYLLHGVTFIYFRDLYAPGKMPTEKLVLIGAFLIASLMVASWICHVAIEKPAMKLSKKLFTKKTEIIPSIQHTS